MDAALPVRDVLIGRVKEKGPISFAEYMEVSLYSDPLGYYRKNVPGPGGDYRTSPTLSPVFGRLLARQLEQMWQALEKPPTFRVAEVGGGTGDLALSVFDCAPRELSGALQWCFIEPLTSVAEMQKVTVARIAAVETRRPASLKSSGGPEVGWAAGWGQLDPADGVILANEVLDNIPFYVLERTRDGLREIRIGTEGGRLVEVAVALEPGSVLARQAEPALEHLEPGDRLEVRPQADDWCGSASAALRRGYLLVIDYGDTEPEIWTRHPSGTVVTYRQEQLGFDPLEEPGERDITAHVNFSAWARAATGSGLTVRPLVTQRAWLGSLGLENIEDDLKARQRRAEHSGDYAGALQLLAERSRASALATRGGLGDLKVFVAAKGTAPLTGFPSP